MKKRKIVFIIIPFLFLMFAFCFNYRLFTFKSNSNSYLIENTPYITEEEYINLGIERAYVVDNYLFDISSNFNPSLKELLVAASYSDKENIKVYELKISTNIYGDVVKEYRELLDNVLLDTFPDIKIKYIYSNSNSYEDVNPNIVLNYGVPDSLELTENDFKSLNIGRAYLIGDYLFDLDNGYNPSLKDLLIAATSSYTNDLKVYELKISENINGDIVEEYSELLSGDVLNEFPLIKGKYIYNSNISNNNPKKVLDFNDTIIFDDLIKQYSADGIIINDALSKNGLEVNYEYYDNYQCNGNRVNEIHDIGSYGVLAKTTTKDNVIGNSKCVKVDVVYGDLLTNSPFIEPENSISVGKYISIEKNNAETINSLGDVYWNNEIEYNSTTEKGKSRFTIKIDKGFVQDVETNYDITVEYYDEGDGILLMQSSSTHDNVVDYQKNGYGGYVEEAWWNWNSRSFYLKNLSVGLTNSKEWKKYTFNVTDAFFEKNKDNYVHFYFGKPNNDNESDYIKIKKITINKRSFFIESVDKNDENMVGNVYTSSDFGMGFSIKNILNSKKNINLSYEIYDVNSNKVFGKNLGSVSINSKENKKYYIPEFNNLNIYGVFDLKIIVECDGNTETEILHFSKMKSDLTSTNNNFLALNINFGFSGWASETDISNSIKLSKKIGVNNLRLGINNSFVYSDVEYSGYNNVLGRYETIYNSVLNVHNQEVLPIVWNTKTNIVLDDNGKLTDECFKELKEEVVEYYVKFAQKYGNYFTYYEILNEWNNNSPMKAVTALQYAEIVVEVSQAIKKVDSDAKIVALTSNDDIWCYDNFCSYYSPTEPGHQNFSTNSWVAKVLSSSWEDENGVVKPFLSFIDAVSIHLYSYNAKTSMEENYFVTRMYEVRKIIEYYNVDDKEVPIWITETGFHTAEKSGMTLEEQASNTIRTLVFGLANKKENVIEDVFEPINIEKVYIYTFQDEAQFNYDGEANLGIVNSYSSSNRKPFTRDVSMYAKPAYVALNMFSYLLTDAKLIGTYEQSLSNEDYYWYRFENNNSEILVLWNNNESSSNVVVNVLKGDAVVYDMYGNILKNVENNGSTLSIDIGYNPVYVVVNK